MKRDLTVLMAPKCSQEHVVVVASSLFRWKCCSAVQSLWNLVKTSILGGRPRFFQDRFLLYQMRSGWKTRFNRCSIVQYCGGIKEFDQPMTTQGRPTFRRQKLRLQKSKIFIFLDNSTLYRNQPKSSAVNKIEKFRENVFLFHTNMRQTNTEGDIIDKS